MGEGVSQTPPTYSEIFDQWCPFYLSIGMTADEYWHGDCRMLKYYFKSYKLKQEQKNQEAWLNGMYFYDALVSAMSHLNKDKNKHRNYAEKPYDFQKKDEKIKVEEARARGKVWLENWVTATQKKFR